MKVSALLLLVACAVQGFVAPTTGARPSSSLFIQRPSKSASKAAAKPAAKKLEAKAKPAAKAVSKPAAKPTPAPKPKAARKAPSLPSFGGGGGGGGSKAKKGPDPDFLRRQAGGGNWDGNRGRAKRGYGQKQRLPVGQDPSFLVPLNR